MKRLHRIRRLPALLALVALGALGCAAIALADNLQADLNTSTGGLDKTVDLGTLPPGSAQTQSVFLFVDETSGQQDNPTYPFNVTGSAASGSHPATFGGVTITAPGRDNGRSGTISFTTPPAAATEQSYSVVMNFSANTSLNTSPATVRVNFKVGPAAPQGPADRDGDGVADAQDNCPDDANAGQEDADGDGIGNACDSNAFAPTVAAAAADANGTEGDTLQTSGAFGDDDGTSGLTVTQVSGAGTVTDLGNGAWSWSLATTDDGSGTVAVEVSDGEHTATDSFDWTAGNADPVLGTLVKGGTGCDPTLAFSFSDPGSGDTHEGSIDWGDGSALDTFTASPVGPVGHHYGSAGTYTISVEVSDDDAGADSDGVSHTVHNAPSGILQPINATGARSSFKLGSTVPVKIAVADCDGNAVGGLGPQVSLTRLDGTPDGTAVETVSTANPTSGTTMRWDATALQYVYNLGTKGLTQGDYRVRVSDGTFAVPAEAVFSLRK